MTKCTEIINVLPICAHVFLARWQISKRRQNIFQYQLSVCTVTTKYLQIQTK